MNVQRLWIGVIVLTTTAMAAWLYTQLFPPASPPRQPISGIDYRASGITLSQMRRDGQLRYRLSALSLTHTLPDDITHLDRVVLILFPAKGSPITLTTPSAQVLPDGAHVFMPDQVDITRSAGGGKIHLTTSDLHLDIHTQTVRTSAKTVLDGPGYHIQGIGLNGNFADHVLELLHHVRSTYTR